MKYEYKLVKTWKDANILLENGYNIKRIDRDKFDRSKLVFWFYYEDGVDELLDEISKNNKARYNK